MGNQEASIGSWDLLEHRRFLGESREDLQENTEEWLENMGNEENLE